MTTNPHLTVQQIAERPGVQARHATPDDPAFGCSNLDTAVAGCIVAICMILSGMILIVVTAF